MFVRLIKVVRRKIQTTDERSRSRPQTAENNPPMQAEPRPQLQTSRSCTDFCSSAVITGGQQEGGLASAGKKRPLSQVRRPEQQGQQSRRTKVPSLERIQKLKERFQGQDSSSAEKDADLDERCCICMSRSASVRAYPCGHQKFCRFCAVTLIQCLLEAGQETMQCILCRTEIVALRHRKGAKRAEEGGARQQSPDGEEHSGTMRLWRLPSYSARQRDPTKTTTEGRALCVS